MDWKHVRYDQLTNLGGTGATGTGMLLSRACQVFEFRAVAFTATGLVTLYDHTNLPQNPIGYCNPTPGTPDMFPRKAVALPIKNGVYLSFSMGTGGLMVAADWD